MEVAPIMDGSRPTVDLSELNPGDMEVTPIQGGQTRNSDNPHDIRRAHLAAVRRAAYNVCCRALTDPNVSFDAVEFPFLLAH